MTLKELREKLGQLNADARKIIDAADAREGDKKGQLTEEESAKVDAIYAQYDELKAKHDAAERADRFRQRLGEHDEFAKSSAGRRTAAENATTVAGDPTKFKLNGREISIKPGTPEHARCQPGYAESFVQYLIGGGIRADLQTSPNPQGGYLTTIQQSTELIKFLDDMVFMRQLATVLPPLGQAVSLGVPSYDADPADADWTAEVPASDLTSDTTMAFGKRELVPHLLTKLIKISQKLIRAATLDPVALINQRLGYKLGVTEEKGFLTGNGSQRPLGVFTASADGVSTARDVTASSTTAFTADDLIDTLYNLKAGYISRATWIFHRDAVKRARKLKDADGQYLWSPGIAGGQPSTILDRPYVMSEFAPNTFTTGLYVGIVGDFKTGYWIVDSLAMEIQRLDELFALKNQVGFVGRKETDGMPVLAEAFSRLKLA